MVYDMLWQWLYLRPAKGHTRTLSFTRTVLPQNSLLSSLNLGVDHWWKTAVWTRITYPRNPNNDSGLPPTHPTSKNSHSSYSQQPCVAVWFLRKLEIYSQCPGLAPCHWQNPSWFQRELLSEVVSLGVAYWLETSLQADTNTLRIITQGIPHTRRSHRKLFGKLACGADGMTVRSQQNLSDLLSLVKCKTLDSDQ